MLEKESTMSNVNKISGRVYGIGLYGKFSLCPYVYSRLYHTLIWLEIEIPDNLFLLKSSVLNFNKICGSV
jgi:hypothetical protein